jgi:hypothetical protein
MFLLGIMGAKGAGKDTVADLLCAETRGLKMSMSTPLKSMLIALGVPPETIEDREAKELPCPALDGVTLRWGMQSLGTEWGRKCISPNLWCRRMESLIADHWRVDPQTPVIIPDVRFLNEIAMIRRNGGFLLRVRRPAVEPSFDFVSRLRRLARLDPPIHASELLWRYAHVDAEIENSGSKDDLATSVAEIALKLPSYCDPKQKECVHVG